MNVFLVNIKVNFERGLDMDTKLFIEKAEKARGSEYDYSKAEYTGSHSKIKIIHNKCGNSFMMLPNTFLRGASCPFCLKRRKRNSDDWIERAKEKNNTKYDYSLVEYKNMKTKVKIICPEHGVFEITPDAHLHGQGCPICGREKNRVERLKVFDKKIASEIHNGKYDYSLVEYGGVDYPVKIICPIHGVFEQTPYKHINCRQGCPRCRESHGEQEVEKVLAENNIDFVPQHHYDDLRGNSGQYLKFDFFIPKYNVEVEFQGEQHYVPYKRFGGEKKFKRLLDYDQKKRDYCTEHGITELEIKYDENIKERIECLLKSLKSCAE